MSSRQPQIYPLIPNQVFLCQPQLADMFDSTGKQRTIFQGNVPITANQQEKLDAFNNQLASSHITLDPYWSQGRRLKLLQANGFNFEKTVADMNRYLEWSKSSQPLQLTPEISALLNRGIVYLCGRDYKYRPIFVLDTKKCLEAKLTAEDAAAFFTYFLDFIVNNMMVEGQVQTWVIILDMGGMGVSDSIDLTKAVGSSLSSRFHNRMGRCYILQASTTFNFVWMVAKQFLYQSTIQKVSFTSKSTSKQIFQNCHPSQIQKKFGGTQPNITSYWPPNMQSNVFQVPGKSSRLLSPQKYYELYINGKLSDRKINKLLIEMNKPTRPIAQSRVVKQVRIAQLPQQILYSPATSMVNPSRETTRELNSTHKTSKTYIETREDSFPIEKQDFGSEVMTPSAIVESSWQVLLEGSTNPVIHYQFNSTKPRSFKC